MNKHNNQLDLFSNCSKMKIKISNKFYKTNQLIYKSFLMKFKVKRAH